MTVHLFQWIHYSIFYAMNVYEQTLTYAYNSSTASSNCDDQIGKLNKDLQDVQVENAKINKELGAAKDEIKTILAKQGSSNNEFETMKSEIAKLKAENQKLDEENDDLKDAKIQHLSTIMKLTNEKGMLIFIICVVFHFGIPALKLILRLIQ